MLWRHADVLTNFFVCFLPILALYYPLLMLSDNLATSGGRRSAFGWPTWCWWCPPWPCCGGSFGTDPFLAMGKKRRNTLFHSVL